jgi:hypothetical protein
VKLKLSLLLCLLISSYSCKNSSSNQADVKENPGEFELKKKELELKEKELDLKEKELKLNAKQRKIPQEEVKAFVENWANIQTNKAMDLYIKLYSEDFQGIKKTKSGKTSYYNYNEWIDDRRKMYSTAKNLYISVYDVKTVLYNDSNGITKVQFGQYYYSENYSDEGIKVMELSRDDSGNIKILKEEMIYSGEVVDGC